MKRRVARADDKAFVKITDVPWLFIITNADSGWIAEFVVLGSATSRDWFRVSKNIEMPRVSKIFSRESSHPRGHALSLENKSAPSIRRFHENSPLGPKNWGVPMSTLLRNSCFKTRKMISCLVHVVQERRG